MVRPLLVPVVALLSLVGLMPTSQSIDPPCPTDPSPWIQVDGLVYIRESNTPDDPVPFIYVESNNAPGLQWGGWSIANTYEPGGPCNGGDLLLY